MPLDTAPRPEQAGLSSARLERVQRWMERYVEAGKLPFAATLIARRGSVAWSGHCGLADVAGKRPYRPDTLVRIYSMTKPVTSAALMMLYEEGLIHLDDPVAAFLPKFADTPVLVPGATRLDQVEPQREPLTLHHLLTHRSGLTYAFNGGLLGEAYAAGGIDFAPQAGGLAATVERLAGLPLLFQPGARWNYSVSTDVLGRVVEAVAGEPLDRFIEDRILAPLAMGDTCFAVPAAKLHRLGPCYLHSPDHSLPVFATDFAEGRVDTVSGGGGLVSTGADYLRFAEMLRRGGALGGERLLGPRTVRLMTANHLDGDLAAIGPRTWAETSFSGVGFGLGFAVVLDPAKAQLSASAGDFNWGGMASTYFYVDPAEELSVVFLTQLLPSSALPLRKELRAVVQQAIVA